jgi:hypothetical protein
MKPEEKARIMYEHLLTDDTFNYMQETLKGRQIIPLGVYTDLMNALSDEDFQRIEAENIFFNIIFSPASNSIIKVRIPAGSKLISLDYNQLCIKEKSEILAIIFHELGHAFNPHLKGAEGEFAADDCAISHGYAEALHTSLERNMCEFPDMYDNAINHQRVKRIDI